MAYVYNTTTVSVGVAGVCGPAIDVKLSWISVTCAAKL